MQGVGAIGQGASGAAKLEAEYLMRVLSMQKDAIRQQGQMAIKLIEAATVDAAVGSNLSVHV